MQDSRALSIIFKSDPSGYSMLLLYFPSAPSLDCLIKLSVSNEYGVVICEWTIVKSAQKIYAQTQISDSIAIKQTENGLVQGFVNFFIVGTQRFVMKLIIRNTT